MRQLVCRIPLYQCSLNNVRNLLYISIHQSGHIPNANQNDSGAPEVILGWGEQRSNTAKLADFGRIPLGRVDPGSRAPFGGGSCFGVSIVTE